MELSAAIELVTRFITNEEKHQDYQRTVELARTYKAMITGCDIDTQLSQFVKRESLEEFQQRVALTQSITPAVAASVRRPYNKVARNDRIKSKIELKKNEARIKTVEEMIKNFYGARRKKNKGLDYWLKTRFKELQFSDPNAWAVLEWKTPEDLTIPAQPKPFEVEAEQAHNFFVVNDEIKWLYVCQDIIYFEGSEAEKIKKDGHRFTLYDEDLTLVFEQVDRGYLAATGFVIGGGQQLIDIGETQTFLATNFDPKLGFAPVVRIGYNRDEETKSRTFVNPWHAGLCFFKKMLVTVSELDLTMALHTFPQKLQYVSKCPGVSKERKCNQGLCNDGSRCTACNGKGYQIHTSAQEAILIPMPESKDEMIPLDDMLVYKAPPIELIKFQNEYTLQLERQVHQAVFNSQVFVKNNYTGDQAMQPMDPTATAADMNMQSVYDTLEDYTEKHSEVWKDFVTMFAVIAGETDIDAIDLTHNFPADPKLKNSGLLMAERRVAKESGAPVFIMQEIDNDLAAIVFLGDQLGMQAYRVKQKYFPFTGKNEQEISELMTSAVVPKYFKVLYANFEEIFKQLEAENIGFYLLDNPKKQAELVKAKVQEFIDTLDAETPAFEVGKFQNPAAGEGEPGEGDDNPGNADDDDEPITE